MPHADTAAHPDSPSHEPPTTPSPAATIVLDRVEGPTACMGKVTVTGPDVWAAARRQLSSWALTAPRTGGYDKVDFAVTFENGFEYTGRFDLEFHGSTDLAEHIRSTAAFWANPANRHGNEHIDPAAWQAVLDTLQLTD